jgi:hypothetical protein
MKFEWNSEKEKRNIKKHAISFDEAVTVFYDPIAATFHDQATPSQRIDSSLLVIHPKDVCSLYRTLKEGMRYELSAHVPQLFRRGKDMKNKVIEELRPEYEFDYSKAVRGKYFKRLIEEGANVAVLEPEVAKVFTSSAAVNEALKSLLEITKSTQRLTKHSTGRAKKLRSG